MRVALLSVSNKVSNDYNKSPAPSSVTCPS